MGRNKNERELLAMKPGRRQRCRSLIGKPGEEYRLGRPWGRGDMQRASGPKPDADDPTKQRSHQPPWDAKSTKKRQLGKRVAGKAVRSADGVAEKDTRKILKPPYSGGEFTELQPGGDLMANILLRGGSTGERRTAGTAWRSRTLRGLLRELEKGGYRPITQRKVTTT